MNDTKRAPALTKTDIEWRAELTPEQYRVLRGKELLADGESTLACIDREGRVQRLPEFLLEPAKAS